MSPRCGCDQSCSCIINEGNNITVTGDGSVDHPYVIAGTGGAVDLSAYAGPSISLTTTAGPILLNSGTDGINMTAGAYAQATADSVTLGSSAGAQLLLDPNLGLVSPGSITLTSATLGFFAATAVAKPTGVAVTAAAIHAALVSLGLIAP